MTVRSGLSNARASIENKSHRHYLIRRYAYGPCLNFACRLLYVVAGRVPESWYQLKAPIFIVGVSRSGTTLFVDEFAWHRDLCNWSEAPQIMDSHFYDADNDTHKGPEDVTAFDAFRIKFLFAMRTKLTGKQRFVNKHPENSLRITYLQALFPDAIFIHVIRDGRATAESNYRRTLLDPYRTDWPFGQFPKPHAWRDYAAKPLREQFAHQWVDVASFVRHSAKEMGLIPDRYLEVRYEQFCEAPRQVLAEVDEFCGLAPGRRTRLAPAVFPSRNDGWRDRLSAEEIESVDAILGELNAELGYV